MGLTDSLLFGRPVAPVAIGGPRATLLVGWRGNMARFYSDPLGTLFNQHRSFGPLSALVDRHPGFLFAFGPEYNRPLTTDRDTWQPFITPMKAPPGSALALLARNPFMIDGDDHRRQRQVLVPPFHRKRIERYRDAIEATARALIVDWRPGRTVDLPDRLQRFTLAVILRVVFGLDDGDDSPRVATMRSLLDDLLLLAGSPSVVFLQRDLPGTPYRRLSRLAETFISQIEALVAERRAAGADSAVIDNLIAGNLQHAGLDELPAQLFALLTAGHETTFASLSWILFLLARHPDVLEALGTELSVLGGEAPRIEQLGSLPLLDRVIKESMRLLPTAPYGARQARVPARLGEHDLPAGSVVVFSHIVTQHMPAIFPEPQRFLPDRWLGISPSPHAYLPFGIGPRACPGADFAQLEMKLALALILQRVWPELPDNTRVEARLRLTLTPPSLPMHLIPVGQRPRQGRVTGNIRELVDLG